MGDEQGDYYSYTICGAKKLMAGEIIYTPSLTIEKFMLDDSFFRVIKGPYGSGKTTGCVMEALRRCIEMPPCPDGVRRSRWVFARNTRSQLKDTLLRSVFELIPQGLGSWKESDFIYTLKFNDVHAEILFRSLDTPEDIQRLLSLQLSGIFIEECREIPLTLVLEAQTRLRRFPRKQDVPEYWSGMICATNPPEVDSEWFKLMEHLPQKDDEPDTVIPVAFYAQPSAISPEAENLEHLHKDYYRDLMKGKSEDWINTNIRNMYSKSQFGKPVYERSFQYDRRVKRDLKIDPFLPVIIGVDAARNPAMVFMQMGFDGKLRKLREAVGTDMSMKTFIKQKLNPVVKNYFSTNPLVFIGDPSWVRQGDGDDNSSKKELKKTFVTDMPGAGNAVKCASTNDPTARINALDEPFRNMWPDGEPGIEYDVLCPVLVTALRSKYRYTRMKTADGRLKDAPDKTHPWSDVVDADQYGTMFILSGKYNPDEFIRTKIYDIPKIQHHTPACSYTGY